jgi:hypothetical protein
MVADSTAVSGGALALVLSTPFTTTPANGSTVYFRPGCDGARTTCISKFNNYAKFFGFPYIPATNPSMFQTGLSTTGASKK